MSKLARMHTAEHILSAVMKIFYSAPRNLELHLGEKKTKCDYAVPHAVSDKDVQDIESLVNKEIARNHPVTAFIIPRDQANKYDLWKVPEEGQEIRVVRIGDFDEQPCGGQHVSNTREVGHFSIISYDL
ncbi:MAG: hypothetical protein ACE5NG_06240, partial [bacterium]